MVSVSVCHLLKNACENNILSEQTEHRSCNEIVQHPTEPHSFLQGEENNRFSCTWCCQSVFDLPTQITKYSTLKFHFKIFNFLTRKQLCLGSHQHSLPYCAWCPQILPQKPGATVPCPCFAHSWKILSLNCARPLFLSVQRSDPNNVAGRKERFVETFTNFFP